MSLPAYDEYKHSGDRLLGDIPSEWDVWKLAHAFRQIGSGTTPKSGSAEYYDNGSVPWINTGDLTDGPLRSCSKLITDKAIEDHSSLKLYASGSLIFAMYGATIGKLGILEFPATVNQACCVFSGEFQIAKKFLFYWFLGLRQKILSLATGGGQPNVSQDILRTLRVACPSLDEQTAIAEFLDRETAKIDDLIAEQKKLIALLKEKRQAVISHAVTKGLNPDAPLKDSGIEWPTKVPEHWEIVRLGRKIELQRGVDITKDEQNPGDVPVVSSGGISSYHDEALVSGPGVLVGRKGSAGSVHYIECEFWPHDTTLYVKEFRRNIPRFVYYKLLSMDLLSFDTGSSNPTINRNRVHPELVSWPDVSEQASIVESLDMETARIDDLAHEAEQATKLLQERWTALISAAVTGKIDVREYAPAEAV